jgi:hypothetical protein
MLKIMRSQDPPKWFMQFAKDEGFHPRDQDLGLDHPRHFQQIALFAPYEVGGKLSKLLAACANRGLVVNIRGACFYSDDTFRIAVYRPEDADSYQDFQSAEFAEIKQRRKNERSQ